jgi:hypothetical protein
MQEDTVIHIIPVTKKLYTPLLGGDEEIDMARARHHKVQHGDFWALEQQTLALGAPET